MNQAKEKPRKENSFVLFLEKAVPLAFDIQFNHISHSAN